MEESHMKTSGASVVNFNILGISVSTNGFQGGDSGHGSKTVINISDEAGSDIKCTTLNAAGSSFRIELGGDSELQTIIESFEFAARTLRKLSGYTGNECRLIHKNCF